MKLETYIEGMLEIHGRREVRPATLELPAALVGQLNELYQVAEQQGVECGGPLFYEIDTGKTFIHPVVTGTQTSMTIPVTTLDNNIGSAHSHPSASIGHKGGYSAHSMQDLLEFEKSTGRPFFMQFVVSGPKIYAMVYVKDVSVFDDQMKAYANKLKDRSYLAAEDRIIDRVGGPGAWMALSGKFDDHRQANAYLDEVKRTTPGFGKLMENLSIGDCMAVARTFKYTFYEADTSSLINARTMSLII